MTYPEQVCSTCQQQVAQFELDEYLENQAAQVAPEIQVDTRPDPDFGTLYCVWYSHLLLGTFYQNLAGLWIAQPVGSDARPHFASDEEAKNYIVTVAIKSEFEQTSPQYKLQESIPL
ncbi:MAG TPA: hypothetical protein VK184_27535 [Nostocaceae cyanobacterium]|nr:hypothetical protein [Nostocaceae cyanobacterium]